jgi:nicotinate-nucleotide adenylyltransferase
MGGLKDALGSASGRISGRALGHALGRVGVFGGSFDPIHLGHLIIAEEARAALALDRVLFVPARRSPLKPELPRASDADRVAMIERAIVGAPAFALHRVDLDRAGPSYTVDTLARLRDELGAELEAEQGSEQGSGSGAELALQTALWFILGADALAQLPTWHKPQAILAAARLAVFERPGYAVDLDGLEAVLPGARGRIDLLNAPHIGISATDLRARVATGRPIRYQVPAAVEAYIEAHGLYRGDRIAKGFPEP